VTVQTVGIASVGTESVGIVSASPSCDREYRLLVECWSQAGRGAPIDYDRRRRQQTGLYHDGHSNENVKN